LDSKATDIVNARYNHEEPRRFKSIFVPLTANNYFLWHSSVSKSSSSKKRQSLFL